MTATELWKKIAAQFLSMPAPGVPPEYVQSFLTRYEALFIATLQKRFDALASSSREPVGEDRGDRGIAALEEELFSRGFTAEDPRHGATAVWSLKTRKHGVELEVIVVLWGEELQLTRHQAGGSTDEQTVPGLEGLKDTLDLWGISREARASLNGPRAEHAPKPDLELSHAPARELEPAHAPAARPEPEAHRGAALLELVAPVSTPVEAAPTPTHDGGLRGPRLEPASVVKGDRAVTSAGAHGQVEKIDVWSISGSTRETQYRFDVKLDSGRIERYQRDLFREVRPPDRVLPDLTFDGATFLSPAEAWKSLRSDYTQIGYYLEKADRARKADVIQEYKRGAAESQARLLRHFATFYSWREQHPDVEIDGFISHLYRIFELMSGAAPRWRRELETLKRLPQDQEWGSELVAGDGVIWNNPGSGEQVYGRITAIDGRIATVAPRYGGATLRLPLFYLLLDGRTPLQVPTYTEPVYLVTLAASMLSGQDRYPKRGAVAAAVKRFLAHHNIDARTRVPDGAGVTAIDLRTPDGERWTAEEQAFMERALGVTIHRQQEVTFEPWRKEAEEWSPGQDYAGKGGGILIAPEFVPAFAHLLASALKDAGHVLNRLGTAWLMRGLQTTLPPEQPAVVSPANAEPAPSHPGDSSVEGCRELEFFLSGYGQIRVVCGAHGRRDVWSNIFVGRVRYGYNGSRWSKGMIPDPAVLNAVAERGITIFGGRRVAENAEHIRYL